MTDNYVTGQPWPGIRYFCTTRRGGVSATPYDTNNLGLHVNDDPGHVAQNRAILRAALPGEPVWLNQVHGAEVMRADLPRDAGMAGCDASVTTVPGQVLAILTADCLPVVFASERGIAAAHAGWRGLAAGVLENTVKKLQDVSGTLPSRAWIGPAISRQVFEVGPEVRAAFVDQDAHTAGYFEPHPQHGGKWLADLPGIAAHRLLASGVAQVEQSGLCTYRQRDLFYSYRREPVTGRQATLIWMEPGDALR